MAGLTKPGRVRLHGGLKSRVRVTRVQKDVILPHRRRRWSWLHRGTACILHRDLKTHSFIVEDTGRQHGLLLLVAGGEDFHHQHRRIGKLLRRGEMRVRFRADVDVVKELVVGAFGFPFLGPRVSHGRRVAAVHHSEIRTDEHPAFEADRQLQFALRCVLRPRALLALDARREASPYQRGKSRNGDGKHGSCLSRHLRHPRWRSGKPACSTSRSNCAVKL